MHGAIDMVNQHDHDNIITMIMAIHVLFFRL